jgi:hypothetical protein
MTPTTFDFSPTIRQWWEAELLTRAQLAHIADIGETTVHRHIHGDSQPSDETILAWSRSGALPAAFRELCQVELKRRVQATLGGELADVPLNLDADGDGKVTHHDAHTFDAKKRMVSAQRGMHLLTIAADGQISADELAAHERMATEEQQLGRSQTLVLAALAQRRA